MGLVRCCWFGRFNGPGCWGVPVVRALWITLAGVEDGEDFDRRRDLIDQNVIRMDHRLAGSGDATGAVEIGVIRKRLRRVPDRGDQPLRGREIAPGDLVGDLQQVTGGVVCPDERQRHCSLCFSITSCTIAIT